MVAEEHYPLPERTQETLEHALLNTIATFMESCQRKMRELIAISVILPGLVDPESGVDSLYAAHSGGEPGAGQSAGKAF